MARKGEESPLEAKKDEKFAEWYLEVIQKAGLSDNRYPIKGMNVWTPYGWRIMTLIDGHIRAEMSRTGYQEVCFPLLVPKTEFQKEAEHIKGFDEEVYWVTHAGKNELDVPLLLRPTSETAMYPIFKLWIRSHADLPLKTYQIVNTYRYETKQTRPFIRIREIHFFEGHTCHADFDDAERQIQEDLEIMANFAERLAVPYLINKRPDWDKFPGAFYSLAVDTLMPNGRSLQLGTIHQYKENFSKPYDITYEKEDGEHVHVHQTTYGMSERLLGAVVGIHGDDKGLVLPPDIAPVQVVIVPIFDKDTAKRVLDTCGGLLNSLREASIRAHLDDRDIRPGAKFYYWELRGVPLRIEIGPRDLDKGVMTLVRRDDHEKSSPVLEEPVPTILEVLREISVSMMCRARAMLDRDIKDFSDPREAEGHKGIARMPWCGSEECAEDIEKGAGMSILGTSLVHEGKKGDCVSCGKPSTSWVHVANSY
jgi:prolyl-tRNA synthetase